MRMAMVLLLAVLLQAEAGASRVAVLNDDIPGLDVQRVHRIAEVLGDAGSEVSLLNCDELASAEMLSAERFDVLMLTDSPVFPVSATASVMAYLEAGGDLVLLGGHAFARPLVEHNGRWVTPEDAMRLTVESATEKALLFGFDDGVDAWTRGSDRMKEPTTASADGGVKGTSMRIDIRNCQWYDVYWRTLPLPVTAGHDALSLWAKADLNTPQIFVEIAERDGARWSRAVDVGTEWQAKVLPEASFLFKQDGSPQGRGGAGDHLDLSQAARITVGLARDRTPATRGDHTLWVDEIGTLAVGAAPTSDEMLLPDLNVFSDYEPYELTDVRRAVPCPEQDVLSHSSPIECLVEGTWAIGFAFTNEQRFIPLLEGRDGYDRNRGWVAGLLVNYAGRYAGSNWLLCGVTTPEWYRDAAFTAWLAESVEAIGRESLAADARAENERRNAYRVKLRTPPPDFLRLSDDGKQFLLPDGRPIVMTGCNYIGGFGRRFHAGPWQYYLEQDFRKAHEAGVNCMRLYGPGALVTDPEKRDALKELARRYGIYLLVVMVDHTTLLTEKALRERVRLVANAFRDEPMVLGYDLQNEPYTWKIQEIEADGRTLGERYPKWQQWEEYLKWAGLEVRSGNDFSTFPNVDGPLPVNDGWREVFNDTNAVWDEWLRWQIEEIRAVDRRHPISVGYNSLNECLPANERLDFVAHHVYRVPYTHQDVVLNLTTLDRIRAIFPNRPIMLGEFGYSNGDLLTDGYLDFHTQAVGEMLHYLYAWANGYSGALKWELCDNPLKMSLRYTVWTPPEATSQHIRQGRFGMYYYDGTLDGRPKPICHALRFFREYANEHQPGGELTVKSGETRIETAYEYRGDGALFVGDVKYEGRGLRFEAAQATNVMLAWDDEALQICASRDVGVSVKVGAFVRGLTAQGRVEGKHGGAELAGDSLSLALLEGETITVTR